MTFKHLAIIGLARSGTSFLTSCIHQSGIPMYRNPVTAHCEDPTASLAWRLLEEEDSINGLVQLKSECDASGADMCGWKEPHLICYREPVVRIFEPAETIYIICYRNLSDSIRSLHGLTGWSLDRCRKTYRDWYGSVLDWMHYHRDRTMTFNFNGDIHQEQARLAEFTGREIDLVSTWNGRK